MITVPLFQRNWPPDPSAVVKSQSYEIISSACAQDPSASCRHRPAFQLGLRERNLHRAALGTVGFDPSILLSSEPGQFSTQAAQRTVQASSPLDLWMCSVLPWLLSCSRRGLICQAAGGTLETKTWPVNIGWSPARPGTLACAHLACVLCEGRTGGRAGWKSLTGGILMLEQICILTAAVATRIYTCNETALRHTDTRTYNRRNLQQLLCVHKLLGI